MRFVLQSAAIFGLLSLLSTGYELQDTIHSLKEENIHLQQRLDDLTRALRDLKQLLSEQPKGISGETHQMLEQVFCESEFHGAAAPSVFFIRPSFLFFLVIASSLL